MGLHGAIFFLINRQSNHKRIITNPCSCARIALG